MASYVCWARDRERQIERESKVERKMRAYAAADMPSLKKCECAKELHSKNETEHQQHNKKKKNFSHIQYDSYVRNERYVWGKGWMCTANLSCECLFHLNGQLRERIERSATQVQFQLCSHLLHTFVKEEIKQNLNRSLSTDWLTDWLAMHFHALRMYMIRKKPNLNLLCTLLHNQYWPNGALLFK